MSASGRNGQEGFAILLKKLTRLRWVVTASHTANPTPQYQRRMERTWIALAATVNDGRYDGWGIEWGYRAPRWTEPR